MLLDKIINTAYSFAAAIVVFGAWAKLEHRSYSDTALTAGLLTETGIFCLYGLLEWRKESDARATAAEPVVEPGTGQGARSGQPCDRIKIDALTETMQQTNTILHRIFRTE